MNYSKVIAGVLKGSIECLLIIIQIAISLQKVIEILFIWVKITQILNNIVQFKRRKNVFIKITKSWWKKLGNWNFGTKSIEKILIITKMAEGKKTLTAIRTNKICRDINGQIDIQQTHEMIICLAIDTGWTLSKDMHDTVVLYFLPSVPKCSRYKSTWHLQPSLFSSCCPTWSASEVPEGILSTISTRTC